MKGETAIMPNWNTRVSDAASRAPSWPACEAARERLQALGRQLNAARDAEQALRLELETLPRSARGDDAIAREAALLIEGGADSVRAGLESEHEAARHTVRVLEAALGQQTAILDRHRRQLAIEVGTVLRPEHEVVVRRISTAVAELRAAVRDETALFAATDDLRVDMLTRVGTGWDSRLEALADFIADNRYARAVAA